MRTISEMGETLLQLRERLCKSIEGAKNIRCRECGHRVRGVNHEQGNHHRRILPRHAQKR